MSATQPSMTEQNLPNGLPPQFNKPGNMMPSPVSFNGVDSSNSSRTSSPANRLQQIPASQLPPPRLAIPTSQLPPGGIQQGANINQLTHNYANLSVSQITPVSSPRVPAFTTSTPLLNPVKNDAPLERNELTRNLHQNREFSPITSANVASNQITQSTFTHSAQSRFTNVPLTGSSNQPKSESQQFQHVQLRQETKNSNISNQAESNNPAQNNVTGSLSLSQNSNSQRLFNESSHVDKTNLLKDQTKVPPFNQIDAQKRPMSAFFQKASDVPKMQQSVSQPLLETPFKDVPLTPSSGSNFQANQILPPSSVPNFGSTPNLYQNQPHLFHQNTTGNRQNLSHSVASHSNGNLQTSTQGVFTLNPQQSNTTGPSSMQFSQQSSVGSTQNVALQSEAAGVQQKQLYGQQNTPKSGPPPTRSQQNLPYASQQSGLKSSQYGETGFQPQNSLGKQPNMPFTVPQPNVPPVSSATQGFKANLHTNRYPTMQQYPNNSNTQFQNLPVQQPQQQTVYQNQSQFDYHQQKQNIQQPQQQQQQQQQHRPATSTYNQNSQSFQNYQQNYTQPSVVNSGFTKMWGQESYDLLQYPNILPPTKVEPPRIVLGQDFLDAANCSPDIFRCTITKIPETSSLLQKSRLPLGILIHPFKDLDYLPVIQCSTIVRCRACRTYINPFVFFIDMKRWKCNLCYRVNELPEEFQFDPLSKTYGDPSRRPEIKSSTIEYIAPSEYMLRPPQPAVYLFLLDVSHAAIESGYLHIFCNALTSNLSSLPGDARTQIGFIAYNSALHFYSLAEGLNQPHEMTVLDIDDVFLPCPDNLIVNLHERKELVSDLLAQLPTRFNTSYDTGSALGAALQAAHKMIGNTGGRITVFQATLPTVGPGALTVREDPSQRASAEVHHLNPANDFYKRLALECSGQQIAVDLFVINSQYVDVATISGISRFSGGCMYHFPLFKASRILQAENLERSLKRYLTRKIGFEAVMRIRCTRGLSIHTFHGNFFVRSTDLLSLPNVNPEAGFGMQVSIDESLSDLHTVCFQAALLYTSSKGERRIRVHTLCVPIASTLPDVLAAADQQCIVGLLSKMAVDRSMQSSLSDAREAFINVAIDILSSYKLSLNLGSGQSGLLAPGCLKLLPLYISALLKHVAFRSGTSTRLDDRVKAMCDMKTLPLYLLIQQIYPDLYPVHNLEDQNTTLNVDGEAIPQPSHLQLSARSLDSKGAFLMDMGQHMVLMVGPGVSQTFLTEALGVPDYNSISDQMYDLPNLSTPHNQRLNNFINSLNEEKPFVATLQIIRENSPNRSVFIEHLIEDRIETALSYHEFLQHLKTQVK